MTSATLVRLAVVGAFAAMAPHVAYAQSKQIEVRLDAINITSTSDRVSISAVVPGAAAVALYLSPNIAIESRAIGFGYTSYEQPDGKKVSVSNLQAGIFLPIHFGSSRGRKGFFVAPGIQISKASVSGANASPGSEDVDVSYGLDVGFKRALHERVSLRTAATYRDGGPLVPTYGLTAGVSLFFR